MENSRQIEIVTRNILSASSFVRKTQRRKVTAAILAIVFGGAGIHKFYLGKVGQGILYIIFSWTFIPMILGIFEGIIYLTMSNQEFKRKYA